MARKFGKTVKILFWTLSLLTALLALVPRSAHAQITVNGSFCPSASIQFSSAGNFAVVPTLCGGNGNVCADATMSFGHGIVAVTASPACQSSNPSTPQNPVRTVIVRGNTCNAAIVSWTGATNTLFAPLSCLTGVPVAPALEQYVILDTCPGLATTISESQTTIDVPLQCIVTAHAAPQLLFAASRKTHGAAGTFNQLIDLSKNVSGAVSVESRQIGNGHVIAFKFDATILLSGSASAVSSTGAVVNVQVSYVGDEVLVTLPSLPDNSRVTVSLAGVNGSATVTAALGFLVGDVNGSRTIDNADTQSVRAHAGQVTNNSNFSHDLKASGRIGAADLATIKARQNVTLAP